MPLHPQIQIPNAFPGFDHLKDAGEDNMFVNGVCLIAYLISQSLFWNYASELSNFLDWQIKAHCWQARNQV